VNFTEFLRGSASGGGGDGTSVAATFVEAVVQVPVPIARQADVVQVPGGAIPPTRFQGDVVEMTPMRGELQVEPMRADMQIIPTRHGLDLSEEDPDRQQIEIVMNSVRITGMALSVGAIWWAARAAGLVASLLASSPAWRHVDPLPVLGRDDDEEEEVWDETSAEEQEKRDDEHRAAWVFEGNQRP
jgi:hypothetical protein